MFSSKLDWLNREKAETLREHMLVNKTKNANTEFDEVLSKGKLDLITEEIKKLTALGNLVNNEFSDESMQKFILQGAGDFGLTFTSQQELTREINKKLIELQKEKEKANELYEYNKRIHEKVTELDQQIKIATSLTESIEEDEATIKKIEEELQKHYTDANIYFDDLMKTKGYLLAQKYPRPFLKKTIVDQIRFNDASDKAIPYFDQHPRALFLLSKKVYLESKLAAFKNEVKDKIPNENEHKNEQEKVGEKKEDVPVTGFRRVMVQVFDVGKKIVDMIDDVWQPISKTLPKNSVTEALVPGVIGGAGFIIGAAEGYRGIKIAYKAINNEKVRQRKTRILRGVSAFALGGGAAGMGLALFASIFGASVAAAPLLPVLIPTALATLYAIGLWKNSYVLHQTKIDEQNAKEDYKKFVDEHADEIEKCKTEIKKLEGKRNEAPKNERALVESDLIYQYKKLSTLQGTLEGKKQYCEHLEKVRLEKEAKVAFTTVEVAAAIGVAVGAALGVAAIIGLGAVSFGVIPTVITLVAVGIGIANKVFEKVDERNDHKYSKAIRGFFVGIGDKIKSAFTFGPKKELAPSQAQTVVQKPQQSVDPKSTLDIENALKIDPAMKALDLATPKKVAGEVNLNKPKNNPKYSILTSLDLAGSKKGVNKKEKTTTGDLSTKPSSTNNKIT